MTGFHRGLRESRLVQRIIRRLRPLSGVRPDWTDIGRSSQWNAAKEAASSGPRVLIATGTGGHWAMSSFESLLGVALTLRGACVHFMLCDELLPACQECTFRLISPQRLMESGPRPVLCRDCFTPALSMLAPLGLPVHAYGTGVSADDLLRFEAEISPVAANELETFVHDGLRLGEHAHAGALRYYGCGDLPRGAEGEAVLRRFLCGARVSAEATKHLQARERYEIALFHHGIYVPQGIVGEVMRNTGVRVVNWGVGYRMKTFLFSHSDTYHKTMMEEPEKQWVPEHWTPAMETRLLEYLKSRRTGREDWIRYQGRTPQQDFSLYSTLGLDPTKPVIGLLTNVIWDARLHFKASAFSSMLEWLHFTVRHFSARRDLQLLIRIHPGEITGPVPARQGVSREIRKAFKGLPTNIRLVEAGDPICSYSAMELCDAVLVYGTKMAVELACLGIPVIVAGEAWARNKGFTLDVRTFEEYDAALKRLPLGARMAEDQVRRARMYAYHLFFERMIPVGPVQPRTFFAPYEIRAGSLSALYEGSDPGLDTICSGILEGRPFIFRGAASSA